MSVDGDGDAISAPSPMAVADGRPAAAPASIYQLHPAGWLRRADAAAPPPLTSALDAALADVLVPYASNLGFTRIELLSLPAPAGDDGAPADGPAPAERPLKAAVEPPPFPLPQLAGRCDAAGLALLPPGSSALLVAASEDGMGFDDPWRTGLATEWRRQLQHSAAADPLAVPDRVQRFATLRARIALMWAQPGAKRVAMGSEFAQARPWTLDGGLDWHLLADPLHEGVQRLVHDLNQMRGACAALREPADAADGDTPTGPPSAAQAGFFWIDRDNIDGVVLAYSRLPGTAPAAAAAATALLVATNLGPVELPSYRFGVPRAGRWVERIATASRHYGGTDDGWPNGAVATEPVPWSGHAHSLVLKLPARATLWLECRG